MGMFNAINCKKSLQILVTTMNKTFDEMLLLIKKMNINCDCIVRSQCNSSGYKKIEINGHTVELILSKDKGLSKNRNELIKIATGDYVLFADDDEYFCDNFWNSVNLDAVANKHPLAITVCIQRNKMIFYSSTRIKRVHFQNFSCGIWCFILDRRMIVNKNMYFDERFGSGAFFNHGEDSIFLQKVFKNGKVYSFCSKEPIIKFISGRPSTWFNGVTDTFVRSRSTLIGFLHPLLSPIYIVKMFFQYNLKKHNYKFSHVYRFALDGKRMRKTLNIEENR